VGKERVLQALHAMALTAIAGAELRVAGSDLAQRARGVSPDPSAADPPAVVVLRPSAAYAWRARLARLASPWACSAVFHCVGLVGLSLWGLPDRTGDAPAGIATALVSASDAADVSAPTLDDRSSASTAQIVLGTRPMAEPDASDLAQSVTFRPVPALDLRVAEAVSAAPEDSLGPLAILAAVGDLGQPVRTIERRAGDDAGNASLLAEADGIGSAVSHVAAGIESVLQEGDLLVVWLLDQSVSLMDDRQEVARRLEPFYRDIEAKNAAHGHRLLNAVVGFGAGSREFVGPTRFARKIVSMVDEVPIEPSGVENVFDAIERSVARYRKRAAGGMMLVVWTDESGDDVTRLEQTIALCRKQSVSVSVVGPTAVTGREAGVHVYRQQGGGPTFYLTVKRGPESALPERLRLPYWFETRMPAWGPAADQAPAPLPAWYGGEQMEGLLSGFGPYGLVRLARETGGTFTILDRPGDQGPFKLDVMRPYLPEYGSLAEYLLAARGNPLRGAVLAAAGRTLENGDGAPPQAEFFDSYLTPPAFRNALKPVVNDQREAASKALALVEQALAEFGPVGMEEAYQAEHSLRWRAWYDLTRGRLLAASVRYAEYLAVCELLARPGVLNDATNHLVLGPWSELRSGLEATARAKEAERLLNRCLDRNAGTPWAYLAQRELDHPLGIALREASVPRPPPRTLVPGRPRGQGAILPKL
jgi:hypothetical protein